MEPSEHDTPYEGNEDAWTAKPRAPSPTPAAIRRHADRLLKEGRLHRDAWESICHHLAEGDDRQAEFALRVHATREPIYLTEPGPNEPPENCP